MTLSTQEQTAVRPVICCSCSQQCGVLAHVEQGRITQISGDAEHPISQGFVCIKGRRAAELHYQEGRVHWPLKRTGERGEGAWQQVSWDEALDDIVARLQTLKHRHGPESVAVTFGTFHGADWGLGERFLNLFGSPNSAGQDKICSGPTTMAESLTYGYGPTVHTSPVPGLTKCIVLWGMRPSASVPLLWKQIVKAHRQGATLIVVDPHYTTEAKQADLWLQLRPGTDGALALGWLSVLIEEGLYDREFVEQYTTGFDALQQHVADYPPQRAAELTWVPKELLVRAARLFARNRPGIINSGNGVCQLGPASLQAARAIACLVAISGNLDREGGHSLSGPPRQVVANGDVMLMDRLPEEQWRKRLGLDRFRLLGDGYKQLDAAMAPAWHGKHHLLSWTASAHEPSLWRAITQGEPYPVKGLFVQHHNPLGGSGNARRVEQALRSANLELLVVHDLFLSPTAQLADYVLPASHWLEKPSFSTGLGYMGTAGDYAAASHAAIEPEYGHRNDYELWRDLGRRLGQGADWPETVEEFWDTCLRPAGLSFHTLAQQRGPWMSATPRYGKFTGRSAQDDKPRFGTPSGRVELHSTILTDLDYPALPVYEEPEIFTRWSTDYPLVLTTGGRVIEGFHQNSQQMPWFRKKYPHPVVQLHPHAAAELGIEDGTWVAIETPIGSVRHVARLDETLHPRVVQADRWWYPERSGQVPELYGLWETNINVCTDDDPAQCDPMMGTWLLRGLPCRLVKAEQATHSESSGTTRQ